MNTNLVAFLQDDLKEIEASLSIIDDYGTTCHDIKAHIGRMEQFVSYWKQHAGSLSEQVDDGIPQHHKDAAIPFRIKHKLG
jgi:hypothetical protein